MADIAEEQELQWEVTSSDDEIHYSYRVESECMNFNCHPGTGQSCNISAFGQDSPGEKLIINVIATSVDDVCRQLSERGFNFPIESMKKFSKPPFKKDQALTGWDNSQCNNLEEVSFDSEACLDYAPLVSTPDVYITVTTEVEFRAAAGDLV